MRSGRASQERWDCCGMPESDEQPAEPNAPGGSRAPWRRLSGYVFWTAAGALLPLALDRLLVHPVLNEHLGSDVFGALIWVLGIVSLFGACSAAGFNTLLMRDYAAFPKDRGGLVFRTSLTIALVFSVVIIAITMLGSLRFADEAVLANRWPLYLLFGLFGVIRALSLLLVTNLRIHRRFRTIFLMRLLEAAVLSANLIVAPIQSLWLIGGVYVLSVLALIPIGASRVSDVRGQQRWFDVSAARWMLAGWYAGALINLLNMSQHYLGRVVVGIFIDSTEVAILYAGVAIGSLFVMPVNILSQLALSLLGGQTTFVLRSGRGLLYLAASFAAALLVMVASWLIGPVLIRTLYADLAGETLLFYRWIAIANGCQCLMLAFRPVALKYAPLPLTTGVTASVVAIQVVALFILVPEWGAHGAAVAVCLAASGAAILWTGYYLWVLRLAGRVAS